MIKARLIITIEYLFKLYIHDKTPLVVIMMIIIHSI